MAVESRPIFIEPVNAAFDQIRTQGSPNEPLATKLPVSGLYFAYGAAPGLMLGYALPESPGIVSKITYSVGGLALAFAHDTLRKRRTDDKSHYLDTFQQTVNSELGELVDTYRVRDRGKRDLAMRWHAADGLETPDDDVVLELAGRLDTLAKLASSHDVKTITMDGDWLTGRINTGEVDGIEPGHGFIEARKFNTHVSKGHTHALYVDNPERKLFMATPQACADIAKKLILDLRPSAVGETLLGEYIAKQDRGFAEAYEQWLQTGTQEDKDRLVYRLSRDIERHLQDQGMPMARRGDGHSNGGARHIRGQDTVLVRNGHALTQTAYNVDGRTETSHQSSDVLKAHGIGSVDVVVGKLEDDNPNVTLADAKVALYTLLLTDDQVVGKSMPIDEATDKIGQFNDTLFSRLRRAHEDRSILQTHKSVLATEAVGHQQMRKSSPIMFAMALAATVLSSGAGHAFSAWEDKVREDLRQGTEQEYGTTAPNFIERYTNDTMPWGGRILLDIDETAVEVDKSINSAANSLGGLIGNLFESGTGISRDELMEKATLPETAYSSPGGRESVGDVSSGTDKELSVYSVTALGDEPTQGYWYTNVLDKLEVKFTGQAQSTYPFENVAVNFTDSLEGGFVGSIDMPQQPPEGAAVLFEVTSPYLLGLDQGGFYLPVKQGTTPIAAHYTYESDGESYPMAVNITQEFNSGMYRVSSILPPPAAEKVQLHYWLSRSTNDITARGDFVFPEHTDTAALAADIREALGVDKQMPAQAVASAIAQDKYYSFTPYADNGQKPVQTPLQQVMVAGAPTVAPEAVTPTLSIIGETIARQPSLNCNMAAVLLLLATEGGADAPADLTSSSYANWASGFYDNGDGQLRVGEAHAWVVDRTGNEIDATPGGQRPQPGSFEDMPLAEVSTGLALAGLASIGLSRRKRIQAYMHDRRLNKALDDPLSPEALAAAQAALYAIPGDTAGGVVTDGISQSHIDTLTEQNYRQIRSQLKTKGIQTSLGVRRALRRLVRVANHNGKQPDYELQVADF